MPSADQPLSGAPGINRFAGADLSAMTDFGASFRPATTLRLQVRVPRRKLR